ncbi:MAG: hypothetical protein LBH75_04405 [Treponema sp.]|nr:hypothetical protein [Treponema sp.]
MGFEKEELAYSCYKTLLRDLRGTAIGGMVRIEKPAKLRTYYAHGEFFIKRSCGLSNLS